MPYKDKEQQRKANREWAKNHRAQIREYLRQLRIRAIEKLGGKCINCGCDDFQALEMNHINGGGRKETKKYGPMQKQLYYAIIAGRRNDIELTCKVCNSLHYLVKIKGLKNNWKITYSKE
jgi:hypothetical protein